MDEKEDGKKYEKKTLIHLFCVLILDLLAFTCILPLFPTLMDFYGAKSTTGDTFSFVDGQMRRFRSWIGAPDEARLNSVFFGGVLGALFSFLQFASSPILGALSDIFGRKRILLLCVVGTLISFVLWSRAATFGVFVLSRVIGGLSKASVSVATAVVADLMPVKERGKGMALIGVAFSTGFIFGPLIGAYFAVQARRGAVDFYQAPAYFAITLTVLEVAWVAIFMPETLVEKNRNKDMTRVLRQASSYVNPRALFRFEQLKKLADGKDHLAKLFLLRRVGLIYFLYLLIYSGLEFTLAFLTHLRFGYDSMQQGKMYFFCGILMILIQGSYVRRIRSERQKTNAQLGLLVIIPAFLLIALARSQWVLFAGLALYATASSLVVTCLTTIVSSIGDDTEKGTIMGVFRALGALARAIGPLIASAAFWLLGPTAAYIGGAVALCIPYILLRQLRS